MTNITTTLTAAFADRFGAAPALVVRAPGRVNLIGEHTDYNDGFVLPAAITVETQVAATARADGQINAFALDFAGSSSFGLADGFAQDEAQPWADYVRAMVCAMQAAGHQLVGADLAITGSIPKGSGLSSSASLCVSVGTALARLAGLGLDGKTIALLAQAAENDFVGMRCGIMDQMISACGVAGHALLIDCRSLDLEPVPMPADAAVMIVHSGVVRGLVDGHYNRRRASCETASAALGIKALRDTDMPMLEAARAKMDDETFIRARHIITENARTVEATKALKAGDLVTLGALMGQSHDSMRDDFAITCPEIDALVAELQALIGADGGARMTGGGFGGAVVAVLPAARAGAVAAALTYRTPAGAAPLVMIETASDGAGPIAA
jgi:galactokinase